MTAGRRRNVTRRRRARFDDSSCWASRSSRTCRSCCRRPAGSSADTKQYLYLDPDRLLARAPSLWDQHIGFGTVSHQIIGYLFPMGPYYWLHRAHAAFPTGSRSASGWARSRSRRRSVRDGSSACSARAAPARSPARSCTCSRRTSSRSPRGISVLLLAVGGSAVARRLDHARGVARGGWRDPALFALVILTIGQRERELARVRPASDRRSGSLVDACRGTRPPSARPSAPACASACSPSASRCGGSSVCGPRARTGSRSSSSPRACAPSPPTPRRPTSCAASATGSSTGATGSGYSIDQAVVVSHRRRRPDCELRDPGARARRRGDRALASPCVLRAPRRRRHGGRGRCLAVRRPELVRVAVQVVRGRHRGRPGAAQHAPRGTAARPRSGRARRRRCRRRHPALRRGVADRGRRRARVRGTDPGLDQRATSRGISTARRTYPPTGATRSPRCSATATRPACSRSRGATSPPTGGATPSNRSRRGSPIGRTSRVRRSRPVRRRR